ncbi:MAG TPA: M56 family metallopeptidase [Candidatus Angelobacter sp.]
MSPDAWLGLAALFISYFLKVAVACLLCWILAALLKAPRQRFIIWLGFVVGAVIYWLYAVGTFSASTLAVIDSAGSGGATLHSVSTPRQFLVPARFQGTTLILGRILGGVYILGMLVLATIGMWRRIRLRLLLRQGTAPSAGLQHLFAGMCRYFGIRHCELVVLSHVNSPATVYWWRPRIVLPRMCEDLGESHLITDVLSHELAHVARRDYLWAAISDVVCGLLFFHPGIWQARKQMRIHREMACDLAVVAARPEHRADYAQTLTHVARLCLPRKYPVIGIDFAAAPSLLRHRVEAILEESEKASPAKNFYRALAAAVLVGAYAFACSAMAVAIAFMPSGRPRTMAVTAAPNSPVASPSAHKTRRPRIQPEGQQFITESPAYRLPSSSESSAYTTQASAIPAEHIVDSTTSFGPLSTFPDRKRDPASVGRTVESVIVSTVGTVLGNGGSDKDDRSSNKRK